jgi:hypothetical protein
VFLGDARVLGFALDGRLRVEIPLGDFRASQIFGARLSDDGPASLVVVAAVPELKFGPAVPELKFAPAVPELKFGPTVPELKFGPTVPELKFGPTYREGRYRLLIVDAGRRTLYDEITDVYPRVLVARGTASDVVFVATGAPLRRLAPLAPAAR